jgi:hypothetical protein
MIAVHAVNQLKSRISASWSLVAEAGPPGPPSRLVDKSAVTTANERSE